MWQKICMLKRPTLAVKVCRLAQVCNVKFRWLKLSTSCILCSLKVMFWVRLRSSHTCGSVCFIDL